MKENFLGIFIIILLNIIILGIFKRELNIKYKIKKLFENQEKIYFIFLILSLFFFQNFIEKELNILENNILIKEIEKYLNSDRVLYVYLGIVSFLLAIYIYCMGIENSFKKYVVIYLIGKGTILYLTLIILLLYLFKISNLLILSLLLLTFYELYKIIDLVFFVTSPTRFVNEFRNIIYKFRENNEKLGLKDLYYELKQNIMLALREENYIGYQEGLRIYIKLLKNGFLEPRSLKKNDVSPKEESQNVLQDQEPQVGEENVFFSKIEKTAIKDVEKSEQEESIEFVYLMYKHLLKKPNDEFYKELETTTIQLAEYFLERNLEYAKIYYNFLLERYKYVLLKENAELEFGFLSGYLYLNNINQEQKIVVYSSLINLINEIIKKDREKDYTIIKVYFQKLLDDLNCDKIDVYVNMLLLYLLKNNNKENWDENLEERFTYVDIKILQDIFIENKKYEQKFDIYKFDFTEPNILGYCDYEDKKLDLKVMIMKFLNENMDDLTEEFILEYYDKIEWIAKENNFKKIEKQLLNLEEKIKERKAIKLSKIRLTKEKIENYYLELSTYKSNCYQFLFKYLCKNEENVIKVDKKIDEWRKKAKGYNVLFQNDIVLDIGIAQQYMNLLDEYFVINSYLQIAIELKYMEVNKKINFEKYWCLFVHKDDYSKVVDLVKNKKIKIYVLKNYNGLKNPILISMKSIAFVLEYLPEDYKNNESTYIQIETLEESNNQKLLELIPEDSIENKKLRLKGSSLLKIYKNIEICFENNVEVYKLTELP
ncbi:hypothetical protein MKD34_12290 (plasmid) [Cetobacterium somerae]|uniref:hypothetical protein n=1 Tax=Cetobacterium somerae TaxID=188913 RepID=UPI001F064987|nr:hypothetical protein [Cetobacterium somerae]UPO98407.1 hypothetical protein MKD34_12290 [Cetobacterium somerae]